MLSVFFGIWCGEGDELPGDVDHSYAGVAHGVGLMLLDRA